MNKNRKKKRFKKRYILLTFLVIIGIILSIFMHFGGFSTGRSINPDEFSKYAQTIENITIPQNTRIIALGEATHGNKEFQELKLDVFKILVEKYNVKAFALEGDFGGCEEVNRYINGGTGSAEDAVNAIDFQIYRTKEMIALVEYMRNYNEKVSADKKLRFYGYDMQRYVYNFQFLRDLSKELGVNTDELEKLMNGNEWNTEYDDSAKAEAISRIKNNLQNKNNSDKAIHFADTLLKYLELKSSLKSSTNYDASSQLRDKYMAENVSWILKQEEKFGNTSIFISGHNMHIGKYGSMDTMGKLLYNEYGDGYYAIGTDFYKTRVNLPKSRTKRTIQTLYSHDPIAKTANLAGCDICWLDFSTIPEGTELYNLVSDYTYMGSIGEMYSIIMRLLPPSYRIFQPPATLYNSMIIVTNPTPTKINIKK